MEQKSPDIIYAQIVAGTLYASREPNEVFGEQFPKYIRKDALLEWLEALKAQALELREEGCGDVFYGAQIALLEETIHKIESL